jgi:predicted  nucleic acid-binding Zn-ribbon protein
MDNEYIQSIISRTKAQKEANRKALIDLQDKLSSFKNQLYNFDNDLQQTKIKFSEITGDTDTETRIKPMMSANMRLIAS